MEFRLGSARVQTQKCQELCRYLFVDISQMIKKKMLVLLAEVFVFTSVVVFTYQQTVKSKRFFFIFKRFIGEKKNPTHSLELNV